MVDREKNKTRKHSFYNQLNIILVFLLFSVETLDNYVREVGANLPHLKNIILMILLGVSFIQFFSIRKQNKERILLKEQLSDNLKICVTFAALSIYFIVKNQGFYIETVLGLVKLFLPVFIAYIMLNTLSQRQIYDIMQFYLILSIIFYIFTIGIQNFTVENIASVNFLDSYSPFESTFFSPSAFALFFYFTYNNKRIWPILLSVLFVFLTFKRFMIVIVFFTLVVNRFINDNRKIPVWVARLLSIAFILGTWFYMLVMEGYLDNFLEKYIGMDMNQFTMGRGWLLQNLQYHFTSYGFGSANIQARSIEMDLPMFYMEMGIIAVAVFVICLYRMADNRIFNVYFVSAVLVELVTSHFYDITFFWIIFYLTIGNSLPSQRELASKKRIVLKFR